jgi:RNA polymerase sigma factor (sigma-70 family)
MFHDLSRAMSSRADLSPDREELLPTRRSLFDRRRNWEDQLRFGVTSLTLTGNSFTWGAIKSGLSDFEAEDLVQETVLSVAKKVPEFVYHPVRCSFKGWLEHVTRLRIMDQLCRRQPAFQQTPAGDADSRRTSTAERVPDVAACAQQDAAWVEEWERNLVDAAMERVKLCVKPEHYRIIHLSAVKGLKTTEVAPMLHVIIGQVYLIRHRLAKK